MTIFLLFSPGLCTWFRFSCMQQQMMWPVTCLNFLIVKSDKRKSDGSSYYDLVDSDFACSVFLNTLMDNTQRIVRTGQRAVIINDSFYRKHKKPTEDDEEEEVLNMSLYVCVLLLLFFYTLFCCCHTSLNRFSYLSRALFSSVPSPLSVSLFCLSLDRFRKMSLLSLTTRSCLSSTTRFVFQCAFAHVWCMHARVHSPVTLYVPRCVSAPTFPIVFHPQRLTFSDKIHRAVCLPRAQIRIVAPASITFSAFFIFLCLSFHACAHVCMRLFFQKLNHIFSFLPA